MQSEHMAQPKEVGCRRKYILKMQEAFINCTPGLGLAGSCLLVIGDLQVPFLASMRWVSIVLPASRWEGIAMARGLMSGRQPATHSDLWFPWAGMPPHPLYLCQIIGSGHERRVLFGVVLRPPIRDQDKRGRTGRNVLPVGWAVSFA